MLESGYDWLFCLVFAKLIIEAVISVVWQRKRRLNSRIEETRRDYLMMHFNWFSSVSVCLPDNNPSTCISRYTFLYLILALRIRSYTWPCT